MLEKGDDTILLNDTALLKNSDSEFVSSCVSEICEEENMVTETEVFV